MKTLEFWTTAITTIVLFACAIINYFSGEYIQACFWMLWIIALTAYDIRLNKESK